MALDSCQRDANVHESYRSTNDARGAQERVGIDGCRLRLAAAYCRSLDAQAEGVDAQKAQCAISIGADESVFAEVHGLSPIACESARHRLTR